MRRVLKWLAYALAAVIVLAALAFGFLQTRWGKSFVRARLEAKLGANVHGTLTIASLEYSPLFRDIELRGVEVRDASGQPALVVDDITATLDRGSLLHERPVVEQLSIRGLDVTTARLSGLARPRRGGTPLASIAIEQLHVDGRATIEKPDGTRVTVRGLTLDGSVHARPAAEELDLALHGIAAQATIVRPEHPSRDIAIAVGAVTVSRRAGRIDVDLGPVTAGAVSVKQVAGHLAYADHKLVGAQAFKLAGLNIENTQLAALVGRDLLRDDASADVSITGPVEKLVVSGVIRTGPSTLALDGTVDVRDPIVPVYDLTITGRELQSNAVVIPGTSVPPVTTSVHAKVTGSGITRGAIDAKVALEIGPTTAGDLAVDGVVVDVTAQRGAWSLDKLHLSGPGLVLDGKGTFSPDRVVDGSVQLHATPPRVVAELAKYGIALPPRVPLPATLDLAVTAHGQLDGSLAVEIQPTSLAIARGHVALTGRATLEHKKLATADVAVKLAHLDLASLARLAGKTPKVRGFLSGTVALVKTPTGRTATYDLAVDLPAFGVAVSARGTATTKAAHADVIARKGGTVVATATADVPFTANGALAVKLDVPHLDLAAIKPDLAGDVELHANVRGTRAHPAGAVDLVAHVQALPGETQRVVVHADVVPHGAGVDVQTQGEVWLRDEDSPVALLDGRIAIASLRAPANSVVDVDVTIPARELADLAWLRAPLAKLGGTLDGKIAVHGPAAAPHIAATFAVRAIPTADGATHDLVLNADGTAKAVTATMTFADAVKLTATVDRSAPDRTGVSARLDAAKVPLRTLLPAMLAERLGPHSPGNLDAALTADLVLDKARIDTIAVAGNLDLSGGEIRIPDSSRTWRDIGLSIAAEPTGLRLRSLELHEGRDRVVHADGFLAWDHFRPQQATLSVTTHNWLVSGTTSFGKNDAPRATLDTDLSVIADLRSPVLAIDATVNALALNYPERFDRAHQYENVALGGDIIYTDGGLGAGKLPYTQPPGPVMPKHRHPIDVKIHIPHPIHAQQPPIDISATGELSLSVRDEGIATRGALTFTNGSLALLGHPYKLVHGSFTFSDEHPHGWLDATFEHPLPPYLARELSQESSHGGATISLQGPPANPKKMLGGANNAGLVEAMSINTMGHPAVTNAPDLPAAEVVNLSRAEQLQVLSFMAANLPRLIFLDRMTAYSDAAGARDPYGRIENVQAERYTDEDKVRVRAVARPRTPGRSSAELQVDRMLINNDHTAAGIGVRAGDRGGGGVGVFVEWSSD